MSHLERIEKKHWGRHGRDRIDYCNVCGGEAPCDVVKLARALDEIRENGHHRDCNDDCLPDCPACTAERALAEAAGEER